MTYEEFSESVKNESPLADLSDVLQSLWHDKKGDWDKAHTIAQNIGSKTGSAIHAYLHREEGDIWNADYWYSRAGRKRPSVSLEEEWKSLVIELL